MTPERLKEIREQVYEARVCGCEEPWWHLTKRGVPYLYEMLDYIDALLKSEHSSAQRANRLAAQLSDALKERDGYKSANEMLGLAGEALAEERDQFKERVNELRGCILALHYDCRDGCQRKKAQTC